MGCCVLVYNVEAKELVMNVAFNINLCNVGITISWFKFNKVLSCYIKSPKDRKVIQCYIKPSLIRYSKSVKIKHDNPRRTYSFKLHVNTSQSRISLFLSSYFGICVAWKFIYCYATTDLSWFSLKYQVGLVDYISGMLFGVYIYVFPWSYHKEMTRNNVNLVFVKFI